jgi:hypothetical protein
MRHLLSLLLSVIITPLIFFAAGYAEVKWTEQADAAWQPALYALPAILAAGLLYAVLVLTRLSPLGLFVAGVVFFGLGMWSLFAATSLQDLMPNRFLGVDGLLDAPINGFGPAFAILGMPLMLTVFSPRRWRRYPNGAPATDLSYAPGGVSAAPEYGASSYSAPSYESSGYTPSYSAPTYVPPSSSTTDDSPTLRNSTLDGPTSPVVPSQAPPPDEER